jgi:hypothetical protein
MPCFEGGNMNQRDAYLNRRHLHTQKDDFRTPEYLMKWLKNRFGDMVYDGACTPGVNEVGFPIDIFNDSLYGYGGPDWENREWIYINPPFHTEAISAFVEAGSKILDVNRVYLLPNKLCQKGFCEHINHHFDYLIMLGGRINFEGPYSAQGGSSMNGCFLGVMSRKKTSSTRLISVTLEKIKQEVRLLDG